MKITDILTESWQNKFADIHSEIQNMTLGEIKSHFRHEQNILVRFVPVKSDGGNPIEGTVAVTGNITRDPKNRNPDEITIGIDGNFDNLTPASEVKDLMNIIRHELSHSKQDINSMKKNYKNADMSSYENYVQYITQPMERSQQVLMAISVLARYASMEDFSQAVDVGISYFRENGFNSLPIDQVDSIISSWGDVAGDDAMTLRNLIIGMAYAHTAGDDKLKAQANAFRKSMQKNFKSTAAHDKNF